MTLPTVIAIDTTITASGAIIVSEVVGCGFTSVKREVIEVQELPSSNTIQLLWGYWFSPFLYSHQV